MPRAVHFEVHATDPERMIRFYTDLFGWKFQKLGGPVEYWVITTGPDSAPGINGGLMRRRGAAPADGQAVNAFVCTLDVPSVDEALGRLAAAGGTVALPKMPVPGIGWLAYIKDPDGNILGIMQADAAAR